MKRDSRKTWGTTVSIEMGISEYERLKNKAEEKDADIDDIIRWMIEEYLDEM